MSDNFTNILVAVIGLCSTLVTVVLVPYLQTKLTHEKQKDLAALVEIGVHASEQIFNGTGLGKEKKEWVINWLKSQGIKIDDQKLFSQINALIENFCLELKKEKTNV